MFSQQKSILALLALSTSFAVASTALLIVHLQTPAAASMFAGAGVYPFYNGPAAALVQPMLGLVFTVEDQSVILVPASWVIVGGLWFWRGRTKAAWTALGFDSEVFELFMRMKGGPTRERMMSSLSMPKDRLRLAQELGLDWKAVDHHIIVLCKYGFVHEQVAYGRVKMYELTDVGKVLLRLLKETQLDNAQTESTADVKPKPRLQDASG